MFFLQDFSITSSRQNVHGHTFLYSGIKILTEEEWAGVLKKAASQSTRMETDVDASTSKSKDVEVPKLRKRVCNSVIYA